MEFTSVEGERRYAALVRAAAETVVGLDFDGVLSPIVEDPTQAHIHPDAADVLVALAQQVRAIAVITGRPARQALDLGGLEEVGNAVGEAGKELYLFGQYGHERWSSTNRRIVGPRPPAGLASFERELPRTLRRLDAAEDASSRTRAWRSRCTPAASPTRRPPSPVWCRPCASWPSGTTWHVEPGKNVVEVRRPGSHKGVVVDLLVEELDAGGFLFAGDDLGDLEAFEAVRRLDDAGLATLRVASASEEENALVRIADVVVPGPDGVLDLFRELTADAGALRA